MRVIGGRGRLMDYRRLIRAEEQVRHEPRRLLLHLVGGLGVDVHGRLDVGVPEPGPHGVARVDLEEDEEGGDAPSQVLEALLFVGRPARAMMGFRERLRTLSHDCGVPTVVGKTMPCSRHAGPARSFSSSRAARWRLRASATGAGSTAGRLEAPVFVPQTLSVPLSRSS